MQHMFYDCKVFDGESLVATVTIGLTAQNCKIILESKIYPIDNKFFEVILTSDIVGVKIRHG